MMFKNIFNFLVYICCGSREEEPKQKYATEGGMTTSGGFKNMISEEYDELVEYLKKQSKIYKKPSICC